MSIVEDSRMHVVDKSDEFLDRGAIGVLSLLLRNIIVLVTLS